MNILYIPTANPLLNTFIRSMVMFAILVFAFGQTYKNAYWAAIVHDAISLSLF